MEYKDMALKDICNLPGVVNIKPRKARASFGLALKAESEGNPTKAEELLNKAVEAEE